MHSILFVDHANVAAAAGMMQKELISAMLRSDARARPQKR
jgi:hypothetical protein